MSIARRRNVWNISENAPTVNLPLKKIHQSKRFLSGPLSETEASARAEGLAHFEQFLNYPKLVNEDDKHAELEAETGKEDKTVETSSPVNPVGFTFQKDPAALEKPEDYKPLANSWNVRQCEVSLTKLYQRLSDTINDDKELKSKINNGFMASLYARRDMSTATLLNTAFRSGLKLRATGKDEDGEDISILISSVSQLSSVLYGLTDGDVLKSVIKKTSISKATVEKLVNSPGNASISTVLRVADATGIQLAFESA